MTVTSTCHTVDEEKSRLKCSSGFVRVKSGDVWAQFRHNEAEKKPACVASSEGKRRGPKNKLERKNHKPEDKH